MLPPTLPVMPAATTTPVSVPTLSVVKAPPAVLDLPPGSRIAGRVAGASADGLVGIKTDLGDMTVATKAPLSRGAGLALVVQTRQPGLTLRIASLTHQRPNAAAAAPTADETGTEPGRVPGRAQASAALVGRSLSAVVVSASAPASAPGAPSPPSPASVAMAADGAAPLHAGARLTLRVIAVRPGEAAPALVTPSATSSAPASAPRFDMRVVSSPPGGPLRLTSPVGELVVGGQPAAGALRLPVGTTMTVETVELSSAEPAPTRAILAGEAAHASSTEWTSVKDVLRLLEAADPAAARHMTEAVLPRATTSLAANLLAFLGMARDGDAQRWLGDRASRTLRAIQPDLEKRLGAEVQRAVSPPDGQKNGEWRAIPIPFATDDGLETVRMMVRHRERDKDGGEDDGEGRDERTARFVLDVRLSRLGRLQLDGLVRNDGKRLELMVRTERPLASALRDEIRGIFAEAGALTGFGGSVGFRAAPAGFVEPTAVSAGSRGRRPGVEI